MQSLSPAQGDEMWLYEGIGMWASSDLPAGKQNRDPEFNQYIDLLQTYIPFLLQNTCMTLVRQFSLKVIVSFNTKAGC